MSSPEPSSEPSSAASLAHGSARAQALQVGFDEAGLVELPYPQEARDAGRFAEWIDAGRAGAMRYLERAAEDGRLVRARVAVPFPWARSALVCFANYNSAHPRSIDAAQKVDSGGAGWIARYAWSGKTNGDGTRRPSDYHKVLLKRLKALDARLHEDLGHFESRAYVDTGPVVERALATAAGLGWTGKNTCLIHPKLGSYGFLAVLLTSIPVQKKKEPPAPALTPDRCGTCRRCLDACPTGALIAPYQMDAARCISYLTIEHKGPIREELAAGMGRQVFGCDICQDVCPWNRKAPITVDPELEARAELINPALEWLGSLDEQSFERQFNGSPVRRAGFQGLRRNVAIAMGNSGQKRFLPWLDAWASAADEGLRAAARWALGKLKEVEPRS
jgi:epoxyqueuosine reductase